MCVCVCGGGGGGGGGGGMGFKRLITKQSILCWVELQRIASWLSSP